MTEATIKGELSKRFKAAFPQFVVLRPEDRFTSGIPDFILFGNAHTSFLEIKFTTNGKFKYTKLQELMLRKLANQGFATYLVVFELCVGVKQTRLLMNGMPQYEHVLPGFDYDYLVETIGVIHGL